MASAKLEQLLAYLDREGVIDLQLGPGRPIAVMTSEGMRPLTSAAVSRGQLDGLLEGTPLDGILDASLVHPVDLEVAARKLRATVLRVGDHDAVLKLALARRAPERPTPTPAPQIARTTTPPPSARTTGAPPVSRTTTPPAVTHTPTPPIVSRPPTPPPIPEDGPLVDERVDSSAIAALVKVARQRTASDLHVAAGRVVSIRVMGELVPLDPGTPPLSVADAETLLMPLLGPRRLARLEDVGYVDLAFEVPGAGRLRANVSRQYGGVRGAFRLALARPPSLEEAGLPRELAKVVAHHQGLVVIAGPSGHGKTTTLAALVDLVNSQKPHHIITIEDPVEIEHPRKQAVVSQREVGRDTASFAAALKASLREDPDVIVIGELRDRETVEIALTAAETGHLVLATMSTPSAAKTIDRLIDMFPPDDQTQARTSIAAALRAVVAQRLLPLASGKGVVPAIELVTGVLPLAVLIRDDKLFQLPNLLQRGRAFGMIRFDESLAELVRQNKISEAVAREYGARK
ncbi:MAG TPA: PilT/PilU family type 4a pilus ATPase [Kofleriaceae bacterium]|nr:PilT/PilU family type 4a pilus ATPase [Kofleriaceae bacterium]